MSAMNYVVYLFPLLIVGGFAAYYLLIYRKGKAAGGGLMEGFAAAARDKWADVLAPAENVTIYGTGVLWRPYWQTFLASQIPALRLAWPSVTYQMVVTDHGRVLVARYTALGGLTGHRAYPAASVGLDQVVHEKPGLAMKLNPLYQAFGADSRTYEATLLLPDGALRLCSVPEAFIQALPQGQARVAVAATA